ncbi:type II toxin-antitoxin system VapC family toxin [uncultured Mucilaginibacter sp.]|uniref:type II toxin-antitoxin system VapC family toxin n=1 Tax=uncultured Mucilaginibacter sp. TaxID=797541 RepID=UPI0026266A33|nr:type II toxin-antitoxin system VapC family toxin [uncultured Mucilaginibacter sp.]
MFDTNVLISFAKHKAPQRLMQKINPNELKVFVNIVSIAESKSIALKNNWGIKKRQTLISLLDELIIVDINENLVDTYAEIDAYSQCRNPSYANYPFVTPRNMGKNDLWIASTAALLGLKLVTTDADFNHLHQVFLEVQYLKPELLK